MWPIGVNLTLRSLHGFTSPVAIGGLPRRPFIQGVTIFLDNGRVICDVFLIAFNIESHVSLAVHA